MYYVFAYDQYYPAGGMNDLEYMSDSEENAVAKAITLLQWFDCVRVYRLDDNVKEPMALIWGKR
jgi:hypothetical protein